MTVKNICKNKPFQGLTALYLVFYLLFPFGLAQNAGASVDSRIDLQKVTEMSYLDILEHADKIPISPAQFEEMKKKLEAEKDAQREKLKNQIKILEEQEKSMTKQLDTMNKQSSQDTSQMADQRRDLHCSILKLRKDIAETKIKRETTTQVEYENKIAKLELAQRWPAEARQIMAQIQSGAARQRDYGNVEDIGVRTIREGQESDVKRGQEAVKEMKQYGMMPPELDDKETLEYINALAQKLSLSTDLKVPLKVTLLNNDEINAFALPGGLLYINSGLITKADNESELAGVMAHEIGHVTARHAARLMKKATIAGAFYQGLQLAAMIFTGGAVSSLLAYYAMQYGFYGLGLAISLTLLGVSRDYEMEADQLGVQYLWKAGYDPKGFITFFDKMASEKGYVRSTSFFRTHPAFADRIIHSFREISFLPPHTEYEYDTPEFHKIQDHLKQTLEVVKKKKPANAPSLTKKRIDRECDDPELRQPPELQQKPRLSKPVP